MKILLDTHVLIWASENNSIRLSKKILAEIKNRKNDVYFSTASLWEIAIKKSIGKIEIDLEEFITKLEKMDFLQLPIEVEHILKLTNMPNYHRDPFDRVLIAQSLSELMKLYTHDKIFASYTKDLVCLV